MVTIGGADMGMFQAPYPAAGRLICPVCGSGVQWKDIREKMGRISCRLCEG